MSNQRSARRRMMRAATRIDTRPVGVAALQTGRLNAYRCPACKACTVTVDVHAGVTPMTLACRAKDGCEGTAFSLGYPPADAWPDGIPTTPTWEWYRPGEKQLGRLRRRDRDAYEHVVKGGLLLRAYGAGRGHQHHTMPDEMLAEPEQDGDAQ